MLAKRKRRCVIFLSGLVVCSIAAFAFSLVLLARSCVEREEIGRVTSPDSALDAVVVRVNPGGAMSSYIYEVFVVQSGHQPRKKDEVFQGNRVGDIQLEWRNSRLLEIHYSKSRAHISYHKDLWTKKGTNLTVEVRLIPNEDGED